MFVARLPRHELARPVAVPLLPAAGALEQLLVGGEGAAVPAPLLFIGGRGRGGSLIRESIIITVSGVTLARALLARLLVAKWNCIVCILLVVAR